MAKRSKKGQGKRSNCSHRKEGTQKKGAAHLPRQAAPLRKPQRIMRKKKKRIILGAISIILCIVFALGSSSNIYNYIAITVNIS